MWVWLYDLLAALVIVCVDVVVMSSAYAMA